jgi:hypothetical protein
MPKVEKSCVRAVQHVRNMRGETQSHLLRCSDGHCYVVKFQNNRQGTRVLANEWIASAFARVIGLPVPPSAAVDVGNWLIENTAELLIQRPGVHFGSQHVAPNGEAWDYIPDAMLGRVDQTSSFYGMLAFDKWVSNVDYRQAVFVSSPRRRYSYGFIDYGQCFSGSAWKFTDAPLYGLYPSRRVYTGVTGWSSFEPFLSRIESFDENTAWLILTETPSEWIDDRNKIEMMLESLLLRRVRLRRIIKEMHAAVPALFPNWPRDYSDEL